MKNNVTFEGKVLTEPEFSHNRGKMVFYKFLLSSMRKSGIYDDIPVITTKEMVESLPIKMGDFIKVKGRFQSYNSKNKSNYGKRILYINALEAAFCKTGDKNKISLEGIVCKTPTYRETPRGKTICDVVLKTYSEKGVYYIPCIFWFENALKASFLNVGDLITINGRLQSREYMKLVDGEVEIRITQEVSASDFKEKENK